MLKALLQEIEYNKELISLEFIKEEGSQEDYTRRLEFDVWLQVRLEVCDFLSNELLSILILTYRDLKDIKEKVLAEYKSDVKYDLRLESITKLVGDIKKFQEEYGKEHKNLLI